MRKGFTLVELLIVMAVIAILIGIAIPSFRGMQQEANKTKAEGDVRVIKIAVESYYKNHGNQYPDVANYQTTLLAASPKILETNLYDPFGATSTTTYSYVLSAATAATAKYYAIYSVGPSGTGTVNLAADGTCTASNDAVVATNGHVQ